MVVCFHWSLLRSGLDQLGQGKSWRDQWVGRINDYTTNMKLARATAVVLYSFYQDFLEATQDELQLRGVRLPANSGCACAPHDKLSNVVMDCVAVSILTEKLHLEAPHWPRLGDTEVTYGSEFAKRVMIPNEKTRDLVYELAHTTPDKPFSAAQLDTLTDKLRQAGCDCLAALLPLIVESREVIDPVCLFPFPV